MGQFQQTCLRTMLLSQLSCWVTRWFPEKRAIAMQMSGHRLPHEVAPQSE